MTDVASPVQAISQSNHEFTFDIYKVLAEDNGNLFFSPISIQVILALLFFGARGNTAKQLSRGLRLPEDKTIVEDGFSAIMNQLQESNEVILNIANKMYLKSGFGIKEEFNHTATKFKAGLQEVDFTQHETRQLINAWVEAKTNQKIKDIIPPGYLDELTKIVLVNAIYFKGDWLKRFERYNTSPQPFHLSSGSTTDVDMMYIEEKFQYTELNDLDSQILYLPYKGRRTNLLIILPRQINGLENLEKNLTAINIQHILRNMNSRTVHLHFPKFKLEYKKELKNCLIKLGVTDVFDGNANLTGISEKAILVNEVLHKSFIEVNEEGTEAAAATVDIFEPMAVDMNFIWETIVFKADHPFLYLILDQQTKTVMFVGRYSTPTA